MTRSARNTRNGTPQALPLDVRLMNAAAALVVGLAVLALMAAAGLWATKAPVFTLRAIAVEGELGRSSLASLRANVLPRLSGNFFSIDLERGRVAFESVPWVRKAALRRVWPNRLVVRLEEHEAVALWQDEIGNQRLVNRHGEVFEANLGDVEDDDLVTLAGPEGSARAMLAMQRRLAGTLAPMAARIETLQLSARGSRRAALDGGGAIELGRGSTDEVVARAERFVRTFAQATQRFADAGGAPRALLAADLRHPDGYALRLRGVSTTALPPATNAVASR